jgi:hypothetical protein
MTTWQELRDAGVKLDLMKLNDPNWSPNLKPSKPPCSNPAAFVPATAKTMLDHALDYIGRGLHVFPCDQFLGLPQLDNWYAGACTKPEKVVQWWSADPSADVAAVPEKVRALRDRGHWRHRAGELTPLRDGARRAEAGVPLRQPVELPTPVVPGQRVLGAH